MIQLMREKEMAMEDSNATTPTASAIGNSKTRGPAGFRVQMNAMERKQDAAQRIGIVQTRPPS